MRPIVAMDLMTTDVLTVNQEMTVSELAGFLSDNEIAGAPVENGGGKVVGVVSVVDIARMNSEQADHTAWDGADSYQQDWDRSLGDGIRIYNLGDDRSMVRDIMNPAIHSVSAEATVSEVAEKMLRYHLHRVLVTEQDRLAGIISSSDLLGPLVDED